MTIRKKLNFLNINQGEEYVRLDIQSDYTKCKTDEELIDLCFFWLGLAETGHKLFKDIYYTCFLALYSEITGKSYQSKISFLQ